MRPRPHPPAPGRGPSPDAIRLIRSSTKVSRAPQAPFGLPAWSDDAALALAVLLDLPASSLGDVAAVAQQLPAPSTLPERTLVVVLGEADGSDGVLGRLFRVRRARVAPAVRGSALLVRGFARLGGSADGDLVWGFVSSR